VLNTIIQTNKQKIFSTDQSATAVVALVNILNNLVYDWMVKDEKGHMT